MARGQDFYQDINTNIRSIPERDIQTQIVELQIILAAIIKLSGHKQIKIPITALNNVRKKDALTVETLSVWEDRNDSTIVVRYDPQR